MPMEAPNVVVIPIDRILVDDTFNCREEITPASVFELAKMIDKDGLLQPPTVRPLTSAERLDHPAYAYALVMGFRRTKACKALGWSEMPAMVKEINLRQAKIYNLVENLGRQDLTFWEECLAIKELCDAKFSRVEIANELGQSPGWVQRRQNVWRSPKRVQEMVKNGILGPSHVQQLYQYQNEDELNEVLDGIVAKYKRNMTSEEVDGRQRATVYVPKTAKTKKDAFRNIKKARNRHEVFNLMLFLRNEFKVPDGPWYRLLAWAGGDITDEELLLSFQEFLKEIYDQEVELPRDGIPEMEE